METIGPGRHIGNAVRCAVLAALGILLLSPLAWLMASEGFSILNLFLVCTAGGLLVYAVLKALVFIKPNPLAMPGFTGSLVRCVIWGTIYLIIMVFGSFLLDLPFAASAWGWGGCFAGCLAGDVLFWRPGNRMP